MNILITKWLITFLPAFGLHPQWNTINNHIHISQLSPFHIHTAWNVIWCRQINSCPSRYFLARGILVGLGQHYGLFVDIFLPWHYDYQQTSLVLYFPWPLFIQWKTFWLSDLLNCSFAQHELSRQRTNDRYKDHLDGQLARYG